MAERRTGRIIYKRDLSPILTIFRMVAGPGRELPPSNAGQYMALRRDDCPLTKKTGVGPDGRPTYGPDLDEHGEPRLGPVTHSYSISSAPWEQDAYGYVEFYIVLVMGRNGVSGRLSSVLMRMDPERDHTLTYVDRIAGTFTLEWLTGGFDHIVMVGTGTGLTPFVAMAKQLHHEAIGGQADDRRYTLLHTNRTYDELAYHSELLEIERGRAFDFVYVPTVSRPTPRDRDAGLIGTGRANNVLRHALGVPGKEHEAHARAAATGEELERAEWALARAEPVRLPQHLTADALRGRMPAGRTLLLTCGNPQSMDDISETAGRADLQFEKEEW